MRSMIRNLVFLGTGSQQPLPNRMCSSVLMNSSCGKGLLFDCGEGTQLQLMKSKSARISKISHIFITHLHGDHFYGVFGLLHTISKSKPDGGLTIIGPKGIKNAVKVIIKVGGVRLEELMKLTFIEIPHNTSTSFKIDSYTVFAHPLTHSVPTFGYILRESDPASKIDMPKALKLGLKEQDPLYMYLKRGLEVISDGGTLIRLSDIQSPIVRGRKIAFLQDTFNSDLAINSASECDVLIHECTFDSSQASKAKLRQHSTSEMAGRFADRIKAKQLILTHFGSRFKAAEATGVLVDQARQFSGEAVAVSAAQDLDVYVRAEGGFVLEQRSDKE